MSEMIENVVSFARGESLLGKGGEQSGIGMRFRRRGLHPLQHDFWKVLHFRF